MQFLLYLLNREVQADRAIGIDIAVLSGDTCPVQQESVEDFCVVADVLQFFVQQQKPWQWYLGSRWAFHCKLTKIFHRTSIPSYQSNFGIDWIDR